jgi:hypothetical protein
MSLRLTRLDGEGSDIDDHLGASLEDDEEYSDGTGNAMQLESLVELLGVGDLAGRVLERVDLEDTL